MHVRERGPPPSDNDGQIEAEGDARRLHGGGLEPGWRSVPMQEAGGGAVSVWVVAAGEAENCRG